MSNEGCERVKTQRGEEEKVMRNLRGETGFL